MMTIEKAVRIAPDSVAEQGLRLGVFFPPD